MKWSESRFHEISKVFTCRKRLRGEIHLKKDPLKTKSIVARFQIFQSPLPPCVIVCEGPAFRGAPTPWKLMLISEPTGASLWADCWPNSASRTLYYQMIFVSFGHFAFMSFFPVSLCCCPLLKWAHLSLVSLSTLGSGAPHTSSVERRRATNTPKHKSLTKSSSALKVTWNKLRTFYPKGRCCQSHHWRPCQRFITRPCWISWKSVAAGFWNPSPDSRKKTATSRKQF